ncbi:hypothetical protein Cni_G08900 [Canna indica]|uniref:PRONE domain-containing protein n=1 Tax=Canna indica TaxID=4628 RepID=A0AAQ3K1B8_9LILI|nr:hypothetical protein Cni_G08900 [Canna indica]
MDSSSVSDDNSELDFHGSSDRLMRSNTDMGCSTPGGNSIDYSRTISTVSTFSELNDEHGSPYEHPPVGWPISKLVGRASPSLTRSAMKKNAVMLDWKAGSEDIIMATRPRSDIYLNLPALEKLDAMLLDILDGFQKTEFWYVEEDKQLSSVSSRSFRRVIQRKEEKWWLPVPCVPESGLSEGAQRELQKKRECANQIHKAAMSINNSILAEMEVPESFLAALPRSGRIGVGDSIYRYMSATEHFCPDHLLDSLSISSEHDALQIADRVEASMHVWRRKASMHASKSSWDMVKDLVADENKNQILASRAESLLLCLKQRYPGLSQTTLDTSKIQYNKDVGQAILESYSRVLESLAFNIVAWIDDVLFVDVSVKTRLRSAQQQRTQKESLV